MSKKLSNPLARLKAISDISRTGTGKKSKAGKPENKENRKAKNTGSDKKEKAGKQTENEKTVKKNKAEKQKKTEKKTAAVKQSKTANQNKKQKNEQQKKLSKVEKKVKAEKEAKAAKAAKRIKAAEVATVIKTAKPEKHAIKFGDNTDAKKKSAKRAVKHQEKVKIIPLGGLEEIGLNITAFEYGDSIIVVDCGMSFPTEDMPGVDIVIPDTTYLKDNFDKVKAFVITHGHEDHIGALPYVLKQLNVPVYATKLTCALIEHKLKEAGIAESSKLRTVKHGDTIKLGDFKVEFVKMNHSIQDASALAIYSPAGVMFHTGDFKIDYTPVYGEPADLQRMAEIGNEGCLALFCDSTNAMRSGSTMSEKTVGTRFEEIFASHTDKRILVATFASNVDRVQQVINTAYKFGRKVVIDGRSMVNVINTAEELGYIEIPEGTLIDISQLHNYNPENTVIITTGSQGESMAALSRMASNAHKKVAITENDVIIMSATPIPGNEKAVGNVVNELFKKGAEVIIQDTHVSGHACQEDMKLVYALIRPKYVFPVHGEYRHLVAQKEIALSMGVPEENIIIMQSGDVVELCEDSCETVDKMDVAPVMVDGLGVGDVGSVVLKDRQILSQNGIIVVAITIEEETKQLLAGPELISRGFVYVKESEDMLEGAKRAVEEAVLDALNNDAEWPKIKNVARESLSSYMWRNMKRTPVIIPIVMQV